MADFLSENTVEENTLLINICDTILDLDLQFLPQDFSKSLTAKWRVTQILTDTLKRAEEILKTHGS